MAMLDKPASRRGSKARAWSTGVHTASHWITIETSKTAFTSGPNCVVLALLQREVKKKKKEKKK